ncbi:MAG: DUF4349 domain-containing protein [Treponema sp.]|jgi:hypothetical protein|nr:DUF4349 domain-containing protein [Treponema sp.]
MAIHKEGSLPPAPRAAGGPPKIPVFAPLFLALALCGCGGKPSAAPAPAVRGSPGFAAKAAYSAESADTGFSNNESSAGAQVSRTFRNTGSPAGETLQDQAVPAAGEIPAPEQSRKLIKSARIRTKVDSLEEAAALVEAALERCRGYASDSSVNDTSRHYTLKVPSARYDTVLREIGNIGKILYQSETVEDATLNYYNLDGRLNTRLELLKTFQAYLGKAETIEDIMTVEKRIAELQQEIDWYGSQLTNLSHLIDYATISLELQGPVSETTYYKPSIADRIAGLFQSFSGVASTALVILLGAVIYGIPALFILILLFWVLFGRIGLVRKVWRLVGANKNRE